MNKRETGTQYEELACTYLKQSGFYVTERNFRSRQGEIDIIGFHQGYLVFVEVKYRTTDRTGTPEEAVNPAKQRKICRTADYYRMLRGYSDGKPVRYDVLGIQGKGEEMQLKWYKNAFFHIYAGQ